MAKTDVGTEAAPKALHAQHDATHANSLVALLITLFIQTATVAAVLAPAVITPAIAAAMKVYLLHRTRPGSPGK